MDYFANYTKITALNRLNDRFLIVAAKKPQEPQSIDKGTIFAIVEIINNAFSSVQIGQMIINNLAREYYKSSNSSDLVNFELAIKKVNQTLADITQNGETEWIGKLNSLLVLICNDQLYIAKTGKIDAYLIRQNKINCISSDFDTTLELHPLKTFGDIISGPLKVHDKLLLVSNQILDYFSQENLKRIIANNDSFAAAGEISGKLRQSKEKKIGAIIIELLTKDQNADLILDQKKEVIYLDEARITDLGDNLFNFINDISKNLIFVKEKFAQTMPYWQKLAKSAKKYLIWISEFIKIKILQPIKTIIGPLIQSLIKKIKGKSAEIYQKTKISQFNLQIHHYGSAKNKLKIQKIQYYLLNAFSGFLKTLKWLLDKKNRSYLYILLVIILSLILISNINRLRNKQVSKENEQNASQTINQAKDKLQDNYKLALLYNNKNQAITILDEILSSLNSAKSNDNNLIKEINELKNKTQSELDKLNNVTRITKIDSFYQSLKEVNYLASINDYIFLKEDSSTFLAINKASAKEESFNFSADFGAVIALAANEESNSVFLLTDKNKLFKASTPLKPIEELKIKDGDWKKANYLEEFLQNIYILDASDNQIWKFSRQENDYSPAQEYLKDKIELKNIVDFTIDGDIYLAQADKIIKLSKGKQQNFTIKNVPKPNDKLTNIKKIYTNSDSNNIYILEGNRLLEISKTGEFISQYAFNDLNDLKDFSLNPKTREIWLLDGSKVYKGNL